MKKRIIVEVIVGIFIVVASSYLTNYYRTSVDEEIREVRQEQSIASLNAKVNTLDSLQQIKNSWVEGDLKTFKETNHNEHEALVKSVGDIKSDISEIKGMVKILIRQSDVAIK